VINGVDNSAFSFLNATANEEVKNDGQGNLLLEDFMALMTTQLQNQDPLKPMDSGDFLGQIASFATVSGIDDLQKSFGSFASSVQSEQALQASSLVGRTVLVPSSIGSMTAEDGMKGQINVAEPVTNLKVQIYDEAGVNVRTIEMGAASGYTNFAWDGFNDNEEALPPGVYQFKASGTIDGENTQFGTAALAKVESVLVGGGNQGLTINLAGIGSVPFKEVQEII
jgi:flagellar basal-body rod modification protein FlgD